MVTEGARFFESCSISDLEHILEACRKLDWYRRHGGTDDGLHMPEDFLLGNLRTGIDPDRLKEAYLYAAAAMVRGIQAHNLLDETRGELLKRLADSNIYDVEAARRGELDTSDD